MSQRQELSKEDQKILDDINEANRRAVGALPEEEQPLLLYSLYHYQHVLDLDSVFGRGHY